MDKMMILIGLLIELLGILFVLQAGQKSLGIFIALPGALMVLFGVKWFCKNKLFAVLDAGKTYCASVVPVPGQEVQDFLAKCSPGHKLTIRWDKYNLIAYTLAVYAQAEDGQEFILGHINQTTRKDIFQYFDFDENTEVPAEISRITNGFPRKNKECTIHIKNNRIKNAGFPLEG